MDTLFFALNAILPIILLIALGYQLKRINMFNRGFLKVANSFVFRVALPVLLFVNVYKIESIKDIDWAVVLYSVLMIIIVFILGIICVLLFVPDDRRKGVVVQATFRSNYAIIGIPLATALGGVEATAIASILSAFSIPLFNVLAVIGLSVFIKEEGKPVSYVGILKNIAKNPLIIGVMFGLLALVIRNYTTAFSLKEDIPFLFKAFSDVAVIASPLALIILGADFEFKAMKSMYKEILLGVTWKIVLTPILSLSVGYLLFKQFEVINISADTLPGLIALFGSPVAVTSAVMAAEMGSDEELAAQLVVWSSIGSVITIFLFVVFFKNVGLL